MTARKFANQQRAQAELRSLRQRELQFEMDRATSSRPTATADGEASSLSTLRRMTLLPEIRGVLDHLELRLSDTPVAVGIHRRDHLDIVARERQPRDRLVSVESHLGGAQSWIVREGGAVARIIRTSSRQIAGPKRESQLTRATWWRGVARRGPHK